MLRKTIGRGYSQLRGFLTKKHFFRQVLVLVSGTALAQAIAAVTSPVLTRLYSPEQFGVLTVYISIFSVLAQFGSLQYENAIPLPEDDDSAANLLMLSLLILILLCIFSGSVLLVIPHELAAILHCPNLGEYFWLIPFSLFGVGVYNILTRWNMRKKTFGRIAKTKVTQSIGMVGTQIIMGLFRQGPLGLLVGDVIGRVGGSGRLSYLILREDGVHLRNVSLKGIRQGASRFKRFPLISGWASLFKELSDQMPIFLLATAYGPQLVGWFMLTQRVLGLPLSLVGFSVGNVYMAETSQLMQKDPGKQVVALYWQTLKNLFLVSFPFVTVIALLAPSMFPLIFGAEWREAGFYLRILSPMYILQFLAIPVSTTVYVLERQDLHLIREAVRFGLFILIAVIISTWKLPATTAMVLLTLSGSAAFIVNGSLSWAAIKQNRQVLQIQVDETLEG